MLHNQAIITRRAGDLDRARSLYQSALRIKENAVDGNKTYSYAQSLDGLGLTELAAGNYDAADEAFTRSLEIYARLLPPGKQERVDATTNLVEVANARGRYEEAIVRTHEKLLELLAAPDDPLNREDLTAILNLFAQGILAATESGYHDLATAWRCEWIALQQGSRGGGDPCN